MERDDYHFQRELTGIHINLEEQAIEFEDRHGTIGRLVFGQEVVLYEGQPLLLAPPDPLAACASPVEEQRLPQRQPRQNAPSQPPRSAPPPTSRGER